MNSGVKTKGEVIVLMHRLGLDGRIGEAEMRLPDPVNLDRDAEVLAELGLNFDDIVDEMGGGPW
jgi:hypothetical protein